MPIDRDKTLKRLAITLNQIAESAGDIARHRNAIAALNDAGRDSGLAQKMLAYAAHMQAINVVEQQRLERMLASADNALNDSQAAGGAVRRENTPTPPSGHIRMLPFVDRCKHGFTK
jgi:hypothetical protein